MSTSVQMSVCLRPAGRLLNSNSPWAGTGSRETSVPKIALGPPDDTSVKCVLEILKMCQLQKTITTSEYNVMFLSQCRNFIITNKTKATKWYDVIQNVLKNLV